MKNIVLIQSRRKPEMVAIEQEEYTRCMPAGSRLSFISALDDTKPWHNPEQLLAGFDGVILGGSGEFDLHGNRAEDDEARATGRMILKRLEPSIHYVFEHHIPTLGVCFGHQLIAETFGGEVVSDAQQKKSGTHDVEKTDAAAHDPLFKEMPDNFAAQYGHRDSVTKLPDGATVLCESTTCAFAALRYGDTVYTTQFHPEMTKEDVVRRFALNPGYLPEGKTVESIIRDSSEASTIIGRFVETIV